MSRYSQFYYEKNTITVSGKPFDTKLREIIINQYHEGKTNLEISGELTIASSDVRGKISAQTKAEFWTGTSLRY